MKIHFTNRANSVLDLISELKSEKTGFILGVNLGNNKIIENILPLNFKESNVCHLYNTVYKKKGDSLLGLFFLNKNYFLSDCFFENIIMTINEGQKKVFKLQFLRCSSSDDFVHGVVASHVL